MALAFVASAGASNNNGSNVTITLPGGMQANDLILVSYAMGGSANPDFDMSMVTAGYTEVADLFADSVQECNFGVFYKEHNGSDTNAVCTGTGIADNAGAGMCMVFRGVKLVANGGPFDVTSATATGTGTFSPNPPSIDHSNGSGIWIVIAGGAGHTLGAAGTYTFPTNYTTNGVSQGCLNDTDDVTVGMSYRESGFADPEDPGVMTHSGVDDAFFAWGAVTMALSPSAAAMTAHLGSIPMG
jgi:hypothetical protein